MNTLYYDRKKNNLRIFSIHAFHKATKLMDRQTDGCLTSCLTRKQQKIFELLLKCCAGLTGDRRLSLSKTSTAFQEKVCSCFCVEIVEFFFFFLFSCDCSVCICTLLHFRVVKCDVLSLVGWSIMLYKSVIVIIV